MRSISKEKDNVTDCKRAIQRNFIQSQKVITRLKIRR